MAVGMGAHVTIIDNNLDRLRELDDIFLSKISTLASSAYMIQDAISQADLIVGAVLVPGAAAPKLVTRNMLKEVPNGAVIVDVAVDQGGCIETTHPTTHSNPTLLRRRRAALLRREHAGRRAAHFDLRADQRDAAVRVEARQQRFPPGNHERSGSERKASTLTRATAPTRPSPPRKVFPTRHSTSSLIHRLHKQMGGAGGEEIFGGDGLGEKAFTCSDSSVVFLRIESAQQDYRQMREVLAVSHKAAQLVTIEIRHQRIGHNHIDSRQSIKTSSLPGHRPPKRPHTARSSTTSRYRRRAGSSSTSSTH
jgi:hypothetical protein